MQEIHAYIARDNPAAAERVLLGIDDKAKLLTVFPEMGYRYRETPEGEVRILLYGHYRIAYLYRRDGMRVDVLGVFHGALDIDRYMP